MGNKNILEEQNMDVEIVGNILIGYPRNIPEKEIELIRNIVRDAQKLRPRCKACNPCKMGIVGCRDDRKEHGHGSMQRCPECGVPYADIHPHSKVCSKGTIVNEEMVHDEQNLQSQLEWKKNRY